MAIDGPERRGRREPRLLSVSELWDYALRILSGRAMSSSEVRLKLQKRANHPGDVDTVIAKLREYGGLNDSQFAENYAAARRDREGFGRMRVLRDLRQRRVAPALASEAVNNAFAETNETEMIEAFLQRKFRSVNLTEHLQEPKNLQSAFRKLRYAGFAMGPSISVLKRYAARADELEGDPEDDETEGAPDGG